MPVGAGGKNPKFTTDINQLAEIPLKTRTERHTHMPYRYKHITITKALIYFYRDFSHFNTRPVRVSAPGRNCLKTLPRDAYFSKFNLPR